MTPGVALKYLLLVAVLVLFGKKQRRLKHYGNLAEGVVSTRSKELTNCSLVETE